MTKLPACILYGLLLACLPMRMAHAIPISLEFTATAFGPGSIGGSAAPESTVSGSFLYEAPSVTADIESLTSIDLTINSYSYQLSDVYFATTGSSLTFQCFATLPERGCGIGPNGRNFTLRWNQNTLVPTLFSYSTANTGDVWSSNTFSEFNIDVAAVPVPPALILFGSGLLGLLGITRRRTDRTRCPCMA